MGTKVRQLDAEAGYWNTIREAARCLSEGGLVVFPTETIYGIGACATHPAAMARLREVKQRPETKPFTVHIGSRSALTRFVPAPTGLGARLVEKAWPGPLTLIFKLDDVSQAPVIQEASAEHAAAMYHEGTIGIRCPDDRTAADLLTETRMPVVAASVNPAGAPPAVNAEEALEQLGDQVDLVLDGGPTRYARPSTIVRVNGTGYEVLREGVLDERTIRRLTHVNFLVVCSGNTCRSPMALGLLRRQLAQKLGCREEELDESGYHVESAGTGAAPGLPPSPEAVEVMRARGVDISGHRSQPLAMDLINRADYIFTMAGHHLDALLAMAPQARDRARRVDERDIQDPIGGDRAVYDACAGTIEQALQDRLKEITL